MDAIYFAHKRAYMNKESVMNSVECKRDTDFEAHPYFHKVQYYETDKMAVTHHSNYIRWMEESRVDFLERLGCGFDRMEKEGVGSPVLEAQCRYRHTTTFADTVAVVVKPRAPGDFKLWLDYKIINHFGTSEAEVAATGATCHCFLDTEGKPVRLKDRFPDLYDAIVSLV